MELQAVIGLGAFFGAFASGGSMLGVMIPNFVRTRRGQHMYPRGGPEETRHAIIGAFTGIVVGLIGLNIPQIATQVTSMFQR